MSYLAHWQYLEGDKFRDNLEAIVRECKMPDGSQAFPTDPSHSHYMVRVLSDSRGRYADLNETWIGPLPEGIAWIIEREVSINPVGPDGIWASLQWFPGGTEMPI